MLSTAAVVKSLERSLGGHTLVLEEIITREGIFIFNATGIEVVYEINNTIALFHTGNPLSGDSRIQRGLKIMMDVMIKQEHWNNIIDTMFPP